MGNPAGIAAGLETLHPETTEALALMIEFAYRRDTAFILWMGKRLGRSVIAIEIMRRLVLAFGQRRLLRVSDYQRIMNKIASRNAVRAELAALEEFGALVIIEDGSDRRARRVAPTVKTIDYYNRTLPRLRRDTAHALCQREHAEAEKQPDSGLFARLVGL